MMQRKISSYLCTAVILLTGVLCQPVMAEGNKTNFAFAEVLDESGNVISYTEFEDDSEDFAFYIRQTETGEIVIQGASENKPIISNAWQHIAVISNTLNFSGTTAKMTTSANGYSTIDKIVLTAKLQRYSGGSYTTLQTYTKTTNGVSAIMGNSKTVSKGYTYRLYTTVKVYKNGALKETVNVSHQKKL